MFLYLLLIISEYESNYMYLCVCISVYTSVSVYIGMDSVRVYVCISQQPQKRLFVVHERPANFLSYDRKL